jgi:dihydrofolate reductase
MAKDPAFLFYPNDFDSATKFFSDEQIGKYLRLLIAQFQHGRLNEKQVLFISKSYDEDIMSKFTKDEKNLFYNERLEFEINKRKNYTVSRSKNRTSKKEDNINISKSYDEDMNNHMENENENRNENKILLRGKKFLSSDLKELPDHYLTTSIQLIKIQKKIDLSNDEVFKMWEVFKTQNLTGETHYNSENKVYLHFTNWLKTQKFEYGTSKTRQQTTNDSLEYITNKGAELYAKLYGTDSKG